MGIAEPSARQRLLGSLRGDQRLEGVELGLVAQVEAVFENAGTRITIRIRAAFVHRARQTAGANRRTMARRRSSALKPSRSKWSRVARISCVNAMPSTALICAKRSRPSVNPPAREKFGRSGRAGFDLRMGQHSTARSIIICRERPVTPPSPPPPAPACASLRRRCGIAGPGPASPSRQNSPAPPGPAPIPAARWRNRRRARGIAR